ncbi:MAG: exodeoxyribonuclease VII small subunit [Clostridia bacterium]|nr:exodeoxyribonuclease VII small subunit [Clostridia bacterium]
MAKKNAEKALSFEDSMKRLEELSDLMRNAPLDDLLKYYTEAVTLLSQTRKMLDSYKSDFQKLSSDGEISDIGSE